MYTIYISKYSKNGQIVSTPFCIYDKRSPADDLKALNPKCNLEDSRAGSLSITIPQSHIAYDYILKGVTRISMYRLDRGSDPSDPLNLKETLIFEGPIRSVSKTFNNDKSIYAEGFFSILNETVQPKREFFDVTLEDYMRALIATHNEHMSGELDKQFVLGDVEIDFPDTDSKGTHISEFEATQFGTTMEYFLNIQERYGGHYIFSKVDNQYRIDYVRNLPKNEGQSINFGENLLDFVVDDDSTDICTAVVPISSVTKTSLGAVGEVIMSSDSSVMPSKYHINENDTDEGEPGGSPRACWGVYENWDTASQKLIGYIYHNRGLAQVVKYELIRLAGPPSDWPTDSTPSDKYYKKVNDNYVGVTDADIYSPNVYYEKKEPRGEYHIGTSGGTGYHVLRMFVDESIERLYLSSRTNTGGFPGFWCYYAYNQLTDLLTYEEVDSREEHWSGLIDKEVDFSYSSSGEKCYTDRSDNTKGELLIMGYGGTIPTTIKGAKYSYAQDPEVGDILMAPGYMAPGVTGRIWYDAFLWRDQNQDPTYYGDPHQHGIPYSDPGNPLSMHIIEIDIPAPNDRDYDAVMITTRTCDYSSPTYPDVYIGDCLWVTYYRSDSDLYQLAYERIDANSEFTSVINHKIDLTDPKVYGSQVLRFTCYGLNSGTGKAPIIPVVRKVKRYADKLTNYLTAENAYADEYHDAGSLVVKDEALIAKYGYSEKRLEFNGIEDPNVLVKRAEAYLVDTQWGNMTMNANGLDMHDFDFDIEAFDISTSVNCVSHPHGLNQYFEVKSLVLNPDQPDLNEITLTEETEGYFSGKLPCSILTSTNELREFRLYGTPDGIYTPGATPNNDIYIYIKNLVSDHVQTIHIERTDKLTYPDYISIGTGGTYTDFESGLIEIYTTSMDFGSGEYPTVQFRYDKVRDGN